MEKFEVVIIGAGPAGLMAAKTLAEKGKKVIVLEKNQVIGKKICAGGAFQKIFQIGIPEELIERKFYLIKIHLNGKTYEIKSSKDYLLSTVDRGNLGQWLAKEAEKSGAKILTNAQVVLIEKDKVILKDNRQFYFDYLIGADGSTSLVRRYLNLPIKFALTFQYTLARAFENLEIFYQPKLFGSGYAWIFPHKNFTKIGCGSDLKFQSGKELLENFHYWLRERKINFEGTNPDRKGLSNGAKLESMIINYYYQGYQFGNIFLIGEAGGFISGLSGAGIYQALVSGKEIAKKILNPKYKPKIISMLLSQKIQEKILKIMNLNQNLTLFFQEFLTLNHFLKTKFFNLVKRIFSKYGD